MRGYSIAQELFLLLACSISNSCFRISKEVTFSIRFIYTSMSNMASEIHSDFSLALYRFEEEKPMSISSEDHKFIHVIVL